MANLGHGVRQDRSFGLSTPITQQNAADTVGVSVKSIKRATTIKNEAPELVDAVKSGEITQAEALREVVGSVS